MLGHHLLRFSLLPSTLFWSGTRDAYLATV